MRIAIASEGNCVSGHFGHCEGFTIYEVEEGKALKKGFTPNPGHRPGYLPVFLKELDINVIIAGGMGEAAQMLFSERDIDVVVGAEGYCDDVVSRHINGELKSTGSVCREHKHEGNCNG